MFEFCQRSFLHLLRWLWDFFGPFVYVVFSTYSFTYIDKVLHALEYSQMLMYMTFFMIYFIFLTSFSVRIFTAVFINNIGLRFSFFCWNFVLFYIITMLDLGNDTENIFFFWIRGRIWILAVVLSRVVINCSLNRSNLG